MQRTLVLGLGNDILRDDRIGLAVVRTLGELPEHVVVKEAAIGGMGLVEVFEGFDKGIIVDADPTVDVEPGTVRHVVMGDADTPSLRSAHDADLPSSLALARKLDWHVPEQIDIVAIAVRDFLTFDVEMTPPVEAAVPEAVAMVRRLLGLFD
jgi:hydrogenase maturation protease